MGCFPSKKAVDRKVVPTTTEPTPVGKSPESNNVPVPLSPLTAQPKVTPAPTSSEPVAAGTAERPPTPKAGWSEGTTATETKLGSDVPSSSKGNLKGSATALSEAKRDIAASGDLTKTKSSLDKPLMPPISSDNSDDSTTTVAAVIPKAAEGPSKPVAFEIPLGDNLFAPRPVTAKEKGGSNSSLNRAPVAGKEKGGSDNSLNRAPASGRLPALGLTNDDIQAKLANTDARWKDLENEEMVRKNSYSSRRRREKPELSSNARPKTRQGREEDPETLKQRLLEKEMQAEKNRQRELQKIQAKLARMDQHVRRVQERKKELERDDEADELTLSVATSSVSLVV